MGDFIILGKDARLAAPFRALAQESSGHCYEVGRRSGWNLLVSRWNYPSTHLGVAIILAGISSLRHCSENPHATQRINVTGVLEHCTTLAERGWRICYISSAAVFDGHTPWPTEDAGVNPVTEYGHQRATVEQVLCSELGSRTTILRLTKYLEREYLPWALEPDGKPSRLPVEAFGDVKIAPLSCRAIRTQARAVVAQPGIHHLSPAFECAYDTLASRLWPDQTIHSVSGMSTAVLPATHPGLGTRNPALASLRSNSLEEWIADTGLSPP